MKIVKDKAHGHHGKSQIIPQKQSIESKADSPYKQDHMKQSKNESVHDEKKDNEIRRYL